MIYLYDFIYRVDVFEAEDANVLRFKKSITIQEHEHGIFNHDLIYLKPTAEDAFLMMSNKIIILYD